MSIDLRQPLYAVEHLKNVLILMADGVRPAADLFLPDSPFPAVLEFLLYRKHDCTAKTQLDYKPDSRSQAVNRATKEGHKQIGVAG
jgi:predicted acyl esterase